MPFSFQIILYFQKFTKKHAITITSKMSFLGAEPFLWAYDHDFHIDKYSQDSPPFQQWAFNQNMNNFTQ